MFAFKKSEKCTENRSAFKIPDCCKRPEISFPSSDLAAYNLLYLHL